jgi:hypothetical protein
MKVARGLVLGVVALMVLLGTIVATVQGVIKVRFFSRLLLAFSAAN